MFEKPIKETKKLEDLISDLTSDEKAFKAPDAWGLARIDHNGGVEDFKVLKSNTISSNLKEKSGMYAVIEECVKEYQRVSGAKDVIMHTGNEKVYHLHTGSFMFITNALFSILANADMDADNNIKALVDLNTFHQQINGNERYDFDAPNAAHKFCLVAIQNIDKELETLEGLYLKLALVLNNKLEDSLEFKQNLNKVLPEQFWSGPLPLDKDFVQTNMVVFNVFNQYPNITHIGKLPEDLSNFYEKPKELTKLLTYDLNLTKYEEIIVKLKTYGTDVTFDIADINQKDESKAVINIKLAEGDYFTGIFKKENIKIELEDTILCSNLIDLIDEEFIEID